MPPITGARSVKRGMPSVNGVTVPVPTTEVPDQPSGIALIPLLPEAAAPIADGVPTGWDRDAWEAREVVIRAYTGDVQLSAYQRGTLIVHRGLANSVEEGAWVLTHLPTSSKIVVLQTDAECFRFGEYLWKRWFMLFRERDKMTIREKSPPWLYQWCKACCLAGAILPQKEYLDGAQA